MYSIAVPKTNDRSWYDKISRAKHNPVKGDLGACRQRVFKAYGDYLATVPDAHFAPAPAPAFAANERDALNDAYTGETKALARMKKRITANGIVQGRCPYCGINEGSDFDHYLPVTHYPQYATFAKNLAPCCSRCNRAKGARVLDPVTGQRMFLNPYFDQLPPIPFLRVQAALRADGLSLRWFVAPPQPPVGPSPQLIQSHFKALGLAARYTQMGLDDLRGRGRAIADAYTGPTPAARVTSYLQREANSLAGEYGVNHYRAVLLHALAAMPQFCDGGFHVIHQARHRAPVV